MIPLFDGQREFQAHAGEIEEAALRALRSGRYILGPEVEALESELATYLDVPHAIGCASGTDAIWLALRAVDVGPGDLVLTTTFTFFATASATLSTGARPVLCDIDPISYNIDPGGVADILEGRSAVHRRLGIDPDAIKAIVPVHLYGQPADMDPITAMAKDRGLFVVEDAAQAIGADLRGTKVGGIGDVGCFSLFPTKNLGGFGDGGFCTTSDDVFAGRMRLLRAHGAPVRYQHDIIGTNSRLDELQAAMLRVRLAYLDEDLAKRRRIADLYDNALAELRTPGRVPWSTHVFHAYVVSLPGRRDEVRGSLAEAGIGSGLYYATPLHLQRALQHLGYREGDFPVAEAAARELLALPIFPSLTRSEVDRVASTLLESVGLKY